MSCRKFAPFALTLTALLPIRAVAQTTLYAPGGTVGNIGGSNIGIGTSNPAGTLDVANVFYTPAPGTVIFRPQNFSGEGSELQLQASPGYHPWIVDIVGNGLRIFTGTSHAGNENQVQIFNCGTGTAGLYVQGNVGIGTTAPGTRLEVKGDETRLRAIVNKNDGTLRNLLRLTSDDTVGANNLELTFGIQGGAAGSRRAQIQAADHGYGWTALSLNPYGGNVGIGTTNPYTRLTIQTLSRGTDGIVLQRSGGSLVHFAPDTQAGNWNPLVQDGDAALIYTQGAVNTGGLVLGPWGTVAGLRITGAGNVGIGTANPTNKLEVNGTIRTKEVIVETTGWADHVLAKGYPLAPLAEVEAHIESKGTLPGIPSAAEVAEHGVSVGEMQARFLAKLEELTLHQIAQEKRLNEQSAQLARIQQENAELRAQLAATRPRR